MKLRTTAYSRLLTSHLPYVRTPQPPGVTCHSRKSHIPQTSHDVKTPTQRVSLARERNHTGDTTRGSCFCRTFKVPRQSLKWYDSGPAGRERARKNWQNARFRIWDLGVRILENRDSWPVTRGPCFVAGVAWLVPRHAKRPGPLLHVPRRPDSPRWGAMRANTPYSPPCTRIEGDSRPTHVDAKKKKTHRRGREGKEDTSTSMPRGTYHSVDLCVLGG